jgi:hypothetical protein
MLAYVMRLCALSLCLIVFSPALVFAQGDGVCIPQCQKEQLCDAGKCVQRSGEVAVVISISSVPLPTEDFFTDIGDLLSARGYSLQASSKLESALAFKDMTPKTLAEDLEGARRLLDELETHGFVVIVGKSGSDGVVCQISWITSTEIQKTYFKTNKQNYLVDIKKSLREIIPERASSVAIKPELTAPADESQLQVLTQTPIDKPVEPPVDHDAQAAKSVSNTDASPQANVMYKGVTEGLPSSHAIRLNLGLNVVGFINIQNDTTFDIPGELAAETNFYFGALYENRISDALGFNVGISLADYGYWYLELPLMYRFFLLESRSLYIPLGLAFALPLDAPLGLTGYDMKFIGGLGYNFSITGWSGKINAEFRYHQGIIDYVDDEEDMIGNIFSSFVILAGVDIAL